MKTCDRWWCEEEDSVPIGERLAVTHRSVITTVTIEDEEEVSVVLGAVDDGPPGVIVEARDLGKGSTTVVTVLTGAQACRLSAGLLDAVDRASLTVAEDDDGGQPMWDPDALGTSLREQAAAEHREHGPGVWNGPFDHAPLALAHLITSGFTVSEGVTESAATWLRSTLAARHVETGRIDREIAHEIAEVLGPDAVQVIGGWVERARPADTPAAS